MLHLKLERTGSDTYVGYYSVNGVAWITVGTATPPATSYEAEAAEVIRLSLCG